MKLMLALPLLLAVLSVLSTASLVGCSSTTSRLDLPPLTTVEQVDLDRYLGTWYEIANFPTWFQRDCVNSKANYTMRDDGLIRVENSCNENCASGPVKTSIGKAKVIPGSGNAKLKVSFFWIFWGDYWIIDLDQDYQWAVVGHPGRDYLWILCRQPSMDQATYDGIVERLKTNKHYPLDRLVLTSTLTPSK